jgi:hypothetical protein
LRCNTQRTVTPAEAAAEQALWAACDAAPPLGIRNFRKGEDFLTAVPPSFHPTLLTWWTKTSEADRKVRLAHYKSHGSDDLARRVQALEQALDIWKRERLDDPEYRLKQRTPHKKCTHGFEIRNCKVRIAATVHLSS